MNNTADYHEKEIKLEVDGFDSVLRALKRNGAKFLGSAFQRTLRYDTENDDLHRRGLFLRLRSGFADTLTMKIKVENRNVFERREIEVEVSDIGKMRTILRELGFTKERIMEKRRSLWSLDGTEVCLDELPFGFFMEIEGDEDKIFKVAEKLGLDAGKKITVTYWDLFERHGGTHDGDIVFSKGKAQEKRIIRKN